MKINGNDLQAMSSRTRAAWTLIVLLAVALGPLTAPGAKADRLKEAIVHFTVSSGPGPAPTGAFTWDETTGKYIEFNMTWNGALMHAGDFRPELPVPVVLSRGAWYVTAIVGARSSLVRLTLTTQGGVSSTATVKGPPVPVQVFTSGKYEVSAGPPPQTPTPGAPGSGN